MRRKYRSSSQIISTLIAGMLPDSVYTLTYLLTPV